jgi:glycosyltransferase involved in cell wall biosynthesis
MSPPLAVADASGEIGPRGSEMLVIGRVQAWKGAELLCEALTQAPTLDAAIRWIGRDTNTAAGGGSLSDALRRAYPGIWGGRVVPLGALAYEETQRRLRTARVVIVPSLWDVFNLAAAEAMAHGRVVVCSTAAGARDLIEDGMNGFVFRAGDTRGLASAIARADALTDAEATAIGQAARATVLERLAPERVARERLSRYDELIRSPRDARPAPSDWLRAAFSAGAGHVGHQFLDQLNVRDLGAYLGRRIGSRVAARARGGGR